MSDFFHERMPLDFLQDIFQVMRECPRHVFQVLTKRHERLAELAPELEWPENMWMGVSVENQNYTHRVDYLRQVPVVVRFLSCEPLLGPLDLDLEDIHWVIVGGESGQGHRPIDAVGCTTSADSAEIRMPPSSSSNGEAFARKLAAANWTAARTTKCRPPGISTSGGSESRPSPARTAAALGAGASL
jgi:hypothetical protein